MGRILDRAIAAEEGLESCRERCLGLEAKLKAILNNEPESASRALSWIGRAQNSEKLLAEMLEWIEDFPGIIGQPGVVTRARAQLHTVEILKRDQAILGERPSQEEWWQSWRDEDGNSITRAGSDD